MTALLAVLLSLAVACTSQGPLFSDWIEVDRVLPFVEDVPKEEVIYGVLDASGSAQSLYVINHFKVDSKGVLCDYGTYQSVANLTTSAPIDLTKDTNSPVGANDRVQAEVEQGDYYYQGDLGAGELPWLISVEYLLNGKVIAPERLAGSTGALSIRIHTRQNPAVDPLFYENYLVQVNITLATAHARNLVAQDATLAFSGANTVANFSVLPGKEGKLELTAQVDDFAMPGIRITALPFSMAFELPDTDEMVKGLDELSSGTEALNDGIQTLNRGVANMDANSARISSSSAQFNDGLIELSSESQKLRNGSAQFNDLLQLISDGFAGVDLSGLDIDLSFLEDLPLWLDIAQETLGEFRNQLVTHKAAIDTAIAELPALSPAELDELRAAVESSDLEQASKDRILELIAGYESAQDIVAAWWPISQDIDAFIVELDILIAQVDDLKALILLIDAGSIAQFSELITSLPLLADGYRQFHEGLVSYSKGVDTLAGQYAQLNSGVSQLTGGISALHTGTEELARGSWELYLGVADLPETMREEIEKLLDAYDFSGFEPRSFVSKRNEHVTLVQFVLTTPPIEPAPPPTEQLEEPPEPTFWERLLNLFR
jgi:X-X-X-Leu-X-X-Gly heptad repeat protein